MRIGSRCAWAGVVVRLDFRPHFAAGKRSRGETTMVEPSRRRATARLRLSAWRRARQLAAAGLCAASFFAGQLLQGQESASFLPVVRDSFRAFLRASRAPAYVPPPQTIVNPYVTGAPAAAKAPPAASKSESPAAPQTVVAANHQGEVDPVVRGEESVREIGDRRQTRLERQVGHHRRSADDRQPARADGD